MGKKEQPKPEIKLFKIETGVELPKQKRKEGTTSKKIREVLMKLPIGGSFVIEKKHESAVRVIIKDEAAFKNYCVTIRNIENEAGYKRVFRIPKK